MSGITAGTAAIMAAGSAASAGITAGATAIRNKKQLKFTKELNEELFARQQERDARQQAYAKELSDYEYQKNLDMWNLQNEYNSPASQMQRYKEAGLNPHLIYSQQNTSANTPSYNAHMAELSQPSLQGANIESTASDWLALGDVISKYQSYRSNAELLEGQRLDNIGKAYNNSVGNTLFRNNVLDLFTKFKTHDVYVDEYGTPINFSEGLHLDPRLSDDQRAFFANMDKRNIAYELQRNSLVQSANTSVVSDFQRVIASKKTELLTSAIKKLNVGKSFFDVFDEKFNTSMMLLNTMQQSQDVFSSHLPTLGSVGSGLKSVFKGISHFWKNRR